MRPYGLAPGIAEVEGRKEPEPLMLVLFEPARSAEPPQNSGNFAAIALMTSPDAARVAISLSGANTGISKSQPAGNPLARNLSSRAALSALADFHVANFASHAARTDAPRSLTRRAWARTSAGIAKSSSGFRPSAIFVALISSAPNADPCEPAVPCALGAGQAITECIRINVGLVVSCFAATIAASSATRSTLPVASAATSMTCHPYARYLAATSSVKALWVSPSIEILLSS